MKTFGDVLLHYRLAAGLSVIELARRMGCSRVQVHRLEGSANLNEASVRRYAAALNLQPALDLVGPSIRRRRRMVRSGGNG